MPNDDSDRKYGNLRLNCIDTYSATVSDSQYPANVIIRPRGYLVDCIFLCIDMWGLIGTII